MCCRILLVPEDPRKVHLWSIDLLRACTPISSLKTSKVRVRRGGYFETFQMQLRAWLHQFASLLEAQMIITSLSFKLVSFSRHILPRSSLKWYTVMPICLVPDAKHFQRSKLMQNSKPGWRLPFLNPSSMHCMSLNIVRIDGRTSY